VLCCLLGRFSFLFQFLVSKTISFSNSYSHSYTLRWLFFCFIPHLRSSIPPYLPFHLVSPRSHIIHPYPFTTPLSASHFPVIYPITYPYPYPYPHPSPNHPKFRHSITCTKNERKKKPSTHVTITTTTTITTFLLSCLLSCFFFFTPLPFCVLTFLIDIEWSIFIIRLVIDI